MNNYDETTAFLGHWGRFQQIVFFLLCASTIPNGSGVLSIIFVAAIPSHHCLVPELNLTQDWLNVIIPIKVVNGKQELSRCSRYRLDVVRNLSAQGLIPGRDINLTDLEQEGCLDGWSYSRDIYQSTIVSETYICTALSAGTETLTGNVRVLFSSLGVCLCFAIGYMVLPLLAYFLRDWKSLLLAVALPGLLYIPLWWFITESPRWLLSQGRVEEAEAIVRNAARKNKVEAPQIIFQDYSTDGKSTWSKKEEHHTVLDLIKTHNIRSTTLILCLVWFSQVTGYFGLSLNSLQLSADPYISCFISAAVEVPGYISSWLALQYFPRRPSASSAMLLGGVSLFFIQLVPQTLPEVSVALEMLGKYSFTTTSSLMFAYTAELYPTVLRSTATGTCATFSRVGTCIAPFLLQLSVYNQYLPYIILGTLAVVSAFATLFLPESFEQPLPETFQQMHKRGRNVTNKVCLHFVCQVVNGEQELSRCSRYRLDVVRNLSAQGLVPSRDVNLTDLEQESCLDGWIYSKDIYQSTIVTEVACVHVFGRKPVLFATIAVQTAFTFASVFSVSWTMFTILLFINGLGQMSNFVSALVLGTEVFTGSVRVIYASLGTCLAFAIGYMMLPLAAYFLRDWKSLLLALSVPCLVYFPLWWFIPESPRWLLSQGRVEEAEAIVRKAAKWNKVQAPMVIFQADKGNERNTVSKRVNVLDLLRKSDIRTTTFILCLVSFTMTVGYYSLSFNTARLHVDPYISCFISAAVEIPAYISSWLALRYLPRRVSVIGTLILGAVPLYLIQAIPQNLSNLCIALEMFGKYAITTGSSLMFAYSAELYPTVLRNTATGIMTTVSRLGSCITPILLKTSVYFKYLPYITLGTVAVASAFAAYFLPESFGRPLPETMQQMHKRERIKCPCITGKETPIPVSLLDSPL
ncbi:Solute carrier family 22 member 5 [Nibea albiflora]|uniref:Solute carrier family 22 member 5 n=1 Tax=Nibea albiflora TaxID=240163 RepID=A0ACB7F1Z8_NIBAL|nr:Solute carrier family 22 member 5 [Nibea albiflora]